MNPSRKETVPSMKYEFQSHYVELLDQTIELMGALRQNRIPDYQLDTYPLHCPGMTYSESPSTLRNYVDFEKDVTIDIAFSRTLDESSQIVSSVSLEIPTNTMATLMISRNGQPVIVDPEADAIVPKDPLLPLLPIPRVPNADITHLLLASFGEPLETINTADKAVVDILAAEKIDDLERVINTYSIKGLQTYTYEIDDLASITITDEDPELRTSHLPTQIRVRLTKAPHLEFLVDTSRGLSLQFYENSLEIQPDEGECRLLLEALAVAIDTVADETVELLTSPIDLSNISED